jgi:glyoxylase-like metal-dependent hydrolase (beta-lactamase superfamily II)
MIVAGFPAGDFQTNCYLLAPAEGEDAIVVDPGQNALDGIEELCRRHRLRPVAALLTHGHIDHMWTVAPLAGAHGIPAYIHPGDRHLLTDPAAGVSPELAALLGGLKLAEPDDVRELADGDTIDLAGVRLTVDHTPGHTRGHVTFRNDEAILSGDLVFAGSIGRSDFPGGDPDQLLASIATRFLTLPDDLTVLPGHGPATTVGVERATNPFLAGLTPGPAPARPETRQ